MIKVSWLNKLSRFFSNINLNVSIKSIIFYRMQNQGNCFSRKNWNSSSFSVSDSDFNGLLWTKCWNFRQHQTQNLALSNNYCQYWRFCFKSDESFCPWFPKFCHKWNIALEILSNKRVKSSKATSKYSLDLHVCSWGSSSHGGKYKKLLETKKKPIPILILF